MKHVVVFGALTLVAGFAACGSESKSLHSGGDDEDDDGNAGEAPGGQGPGGESTGGWSGIGGASGAGGRGLGGRGGSGGSGGRGGIGGRGGGAGALGEGGGGGLCSVYDCSLLSHVRPGAAVECVNGACVIPPEACEEGFAHCSANVNVGCETDVRSGTNCGACGNTCTDLAPLCTLGSSGWHCSTGCEGPTSVRCGFNCTNVDTDPGNCGRCGNECQVHALGQCVAGECSRIGPCETHFGDCTDAVGCETNLTTPDDCGACGRNDCGAANAVTECSSASGCVPPTCVVGFANCDRTSPDCEAHGTACFPMALAPIELAQSPTRIAVVDGGALFAFGTYGYTVDFDASAAVDTQTAVGDTDAYFTRYEPNGAYAWTRSFGGPLTDFAYSAGVARDGTLLVSGMFFGSADLDPGSGVDPHVADTAGSAFVSKLTTSGNLVWGRDLRGEVMVDQLAGDALGAVYAIGRFYDTVDLDPGPATALHTAGDEGGTFLLKLDASGNFAWDVLIEGHGERMFTGLAVAADGSAWVAGRHSFGMSLGERPFAEEAGTFFAAFEASGTLRTLWEPGPSARYGDYPTVGAGANVYVEGTFDDSLDVDPGSQTATRLTLHPNDTSGFAVGLGVNGTYRNAHVFEAEPLAIFETPGGGSLVLSPLELLGEDSEPNLFAYYADGTSAWTLRSGTTLYPELSVSSTHFAVSGVEPVAALGPARDDLGVVLETPVVRRYAF